MSDSVVSRVLFNVVRFTLLFIVIVLLAFAYFFNKDDIMLSTWQKTEAKVFDAKIIQKTVTVMNRAAISYDIEVDYAYIVNKKRYDSNDLFAYGETPKTLTKQYFLEQAQTIKPNAVVDVYYNPKNPEESFLLRNRSEGSIAFYESVLVLLYITIAMFLIQPILAVFGYFREKEKSAKVFEFVIPEKAKRLVSRQRGR